MKLLANCMLTCLISYLIAVCQISYGHARALTSSTLAESVKNNSTNRNATVAGVQGIQMPKNGTAVTALPAPSESLELSQPTGGAEIARIRRQFDDDSTDEISLGYDLHTLHMPCDFDLTYLRNTIGFYPEHCKTSFNSRHRNEQYFRLFKSYGLEAFFFGQYYERITRFERDPHIFDYADVVL